MNMDNELQQKQKTLKEETSKGAESTIPAYFFNLIGNKIEKLFRLTKRPHWIVNAFILGVLIFLPGFLISILTGEIYEWGELHRFYVSSALAAYLPPIIVYLNLTYNVLPVIRDHIIDSIQEVEDLERLSGWLGSLWSVRKWMLVNLYIGIPYFVFVQIFESFGIGKFIGFGILVINFMVLFLFISPFYFLYKMLILPSLLSDFRLKLYETDPVNSEVIQRLGGMLNINLYYIAGYITIFTLTTALNSPIWFMGLVILLGWIPTILLFLVNQSAIRKIVISTKWRYINRLQNRIGELQNDILTDASDKVIMQLDQLMNFLDRINAKPNSTLNWGTGLSLLNQLMLPLLGLVVSNLDKLLNLLKS